MTHDSPILAYMVRKEYNAIEYHPYPLGTVQWVFELYLWLYQKKTKREHPNVKAAQIRGIIETMPYFEHPDSEVRCSDIDAENYKPMMEKHFATKYQHGCDYNINHFFSGDIRSMRFYDSGLYDGRCDESEDLPL